MTPALHPYPEYKPSGVKWLGDAPGHWEVVRLKGNTANVVDLTREARSDDIYLALEHVESWTGRLNASIDGVAFDSQVKRFRAGDVLFGKLRPYLAKVTCPDRDGVCVGEFLVLRPNVANLSPKYLEQILRSKPVIDAVDASTFGAKMPRADWQFIGDMRIAIPPLKEQFAIVRCLDYVDRRVRRYVEAKRKLIALLVEERQAVIHQAVTRGLDPNVPLKPSAVEWLGDVPDHWMVNKTTRLFSIGSGTTPPTDSPRHYGGGIAWVTTSELRESVVTATKKTITRDALSEFPVLSIYPEESVAVAMYGATIGRIGILGIPAAVNQACCVFTTKGQVLPWFWFYWLQARRPYLLSLGYGGGQPNLSRELLKAIRFPTPPLQEQVAIVNYLERAIANFDDAIARARRQIELSEEYRTRLIADVVTGKLDVRAAAAQLPDEADDEHSMKVEQVS